MKIEIEIDELESAIKIIFAHIRETGVKSVQLEDDFYWDIDMEDLYEVTRNPENFSIGQLTDDLQEMHKIVAGTGTPVGYCLVWAAALCRYIGEKSRG